MTRKRCARCEAEPHTSVGNGPVVWLIVGPATNEYTCGEHLQDACAVVVDSDVDEWDEDGNGIHVRVFRYRALVDPSKLVVRSVVDTTGRGNVGHEFTEERPGVWKSATPEAAARLDASIDEALAKAFGTSLAELREQDPTEAPE